MSGRSTAAPRRNRRPVRTECARSAFALALASRTLVRRGLIVLAWVLIASGLRAVAVADEANVVASGGAAAADARRDGFRRRPYIAFGGGVSRLEPESPSPALEISEDIAGGIELGVGYDFTRWLSGELHVADLGAADVDFLGDTVGDVGYQVYGASAIVYLFGTRDGFIPFATGGDGAFRKQGLSLFARFGVGGMSNDSELDYRRDHDSHAVFGAGLEYGFRNGIALRAELQAFDTDARYAGLSVLKRFGTAAGASPLAAAAPAAKAASPGPAVPAALADPAAAPAAPAAALPAPLPLPAADAPTLIRPVEPPYVYFAFDRADLSETALAKLDAFVDDMKGNELDIAVGGHADRIGSERYNVILSERRASAVRDYLVSRGIPAARISTRGYGEARPVSSNATAEGRAQNRRAEIRLERGAARSAGTADRREDATRTARARTPAAR